MADSTRTCAADPAVLSRRDAIVAALALAAGALVATRPDPARAATWDNMIVGSINIASSPTYAWRTATGHLEPVITQAALNFDNGLGVHHAVDGEVFAIAGTAAVGVRGTAASIGQFGVVAEHKAPAGTALRVNGIASFSRSGRSTISAGKSVKTVSGLSNITANSKILVTLQGNAGTGRYVRYAQRLSDTSFKVVLNGTATYKVAFAWMIVD